MNLLMLLSVRLIITKFRVLASISKLFLVLQVFRTKLTKHFHVQAKMSTGKADNFYIS